LIELRPTDPAELDTICELEQDAETSPYILPTTRAQHETNMARADFVYLSICRDEGFAGYFILVLEADGRSVELRRIVIAEKGAGTGKQAMLRVEAWCREQLGRSRIWLDVFDFNERGMHIYPRLGYRYIGRQDLDGSQLLFFEKHLR